MLRINREAECLACGFDEVLCVEDVEMEGEWCPVCGHLKLLKWHRPTVEEIVMARELTKKLCDEDREKLQGFPVGDSLVGRMNCNEAKI